MSSQKIRIRLLVVAILLSAFLCVHADPEGTDVQLRVERVSRVKRGNFNTVNVHVTVLNRSSGPVYVEESASGNPRLLHALSVHQWEENRGWVYVGPGGELPALSLVKIDPRSEVRSTITLHDPFVAEYPYRRIAIQGKHRARLRYFESEEQWKHLRAALSGKSKSKLSPPEVFSSEFEVLPLSEPQS